MCQSPHQSDQVPGANQQKSENLGGKRIALKWLFILILILSPFVAWGQFPVELVDLLFLCCDDLYQMVQWFLVYALMVPWPWRFVLALCFQHFLFFPFRMFLALIKNKLFSFCSENLAILSAALKVKFFLYIFRCFLRSCCLKLLFLLLFAAFVIPIGRLLNFGMFWQFDATISVFVSGSGLETALGL